MSLTLTEVSTLTLSTSALDLTKSADRAALQEAVAVAICVGLVSATCSATLVAESAIRRRDLEDLDADDVDGEPLARRDAQDVDADTEPSTLRTHVERQESDSTRQHLQDAAARGDSSIVTLSSGRERGRVLSNIATLSTQREYNAYQVGLPISSPSLSPSPSPNHQSPSTTHPHPYPSSHSSSYLPSPSPLCTNHTLAPALTLAPSPSPGTALALAPILNPLAYPDTHLNRNQAGVVSRSTPISSLLAGNAALAALDPQLLMLAVEVTALSARMSIITQGTSSTSDVANTFSDADALADGMECISTEPPATLMLSESPLTLILTSHLQLPPYSPLDQHPSTDPQPQALTLTHAHSSSPSACPSPS